MRALLERLRSSAPFLLLSVLLAASASALPITLYADRAPGTGFAPADVAAALAAGAEAPTVVGGLGDGGGYFVLTTSDGVPAARGKSRRKPGRGDSTWTLHVAPEAPAPLLEDVHVVVLGHDPHDPRRYKTRNVGLEIGTELPWLLVTPASGGPTYLAYRLGDLEPGGAYEIPIEYRVGQKLKKRRGAFFFPRYAVAYVTLPEPSTLGLALAGLVFGLAARGRSRPPTFPMV